MVDDRGESVDRYVEAMAARGCSPRWIKMREG
jgi:hypothetical protein